MGFYQRYMEMEAVEGRLSEINKAARYVDRKDRKRKDRRLLFYGMTAYCIALALAGWFLGVM